MDIKSYKTTKCYLQHRVITLSICLKLNQSIIDIQRIVVENKCHIRHKPFIKMSEQNTDYPQVQRLQPLR
jgi:hypothetical protein